MTKSDTGQIDDNADFANHDDYHDCANRAPSGSPPPSLRIPSKTPSKLPPGALRRGGSVSPSSPHRVDLNEMCAKLQVDVLNPKCEVPVASWRPRIGGPLEFLVVKIWTKPNPDLRAPPPKLLLARLSRLVQALELPRPPLALLALVRPLHQHDVRHGVLDAAGVQAVYVHRSEVVAQDMVSGPEVCCRRPWKRPMMAERTNVPEPWGLEAIHHLPEARPACPKAARRSRSSALFRPSFAKVGQTSDPNSAQHCQQ